MAILFAVVARGTTILAKHAWCGGNFLEDFERSRAFNFLNEIKKRFQTTYGSRAQTALPYAMNSEFSSVLAAQLKHHSENKGLDKVMETQAQVDELKGIMVRNIDLVAQRGERLELLIDKTENLVDSVIITYFLLFCIIPLCKSTTICLSVLLCGALFLDSLFCSVGQFVYLYASATLC
uniref:AP-3 complex subunit delta-1 n=1 Tax=Mandrillus leucophaeus TaxID=9568 RepID=A0A2K5XRH2_MANLE